MILPLIAVFYRIIVQAMSWMRQKMAASKIMILLVLIASSRHSLSRSTSFNVSETILMWFSILSTLRKWLDFKNREVFSSFEISASSIPFYIFKNNCDSK